MSAGNGADTLVGGYGADTLTGGAGADHFRYLDQKDTNDLIVDFSVGDVIDLSGIDANTATPTDDALAVLNNGSALTSYGASWYQDSANTYLIADTDGVVSTAEFMLTINGLRDLSPPGTIVM